MRAGLILAAAGLASAAAVEKRQTNVPQYFQTTPELYPGPTPTGAAAFLAQTNPAPFPSTAYIPPTPLETQVPINGTPAQGAVELAYNPDGNIFHLHGQLSHYFPNPVGFGVDEYSLPPGANITALHMLHRHGARYPTSTTSTVTKIVNATGKFNATGKLAFLNTWTYKLGEQILTPVGKQELFDSGALHQYLYGHLYNNNGSKIIARTTSQDRMLQSAEYFMAGFFGLQWQNNATLEVIIEQNLFNNSLAGYFQCNNSNGPQSAGGSNASSTWQAIYLAAAQPRINALIASPANFFTISDVYNLQSLCAYETVALGYSAFCDLFTYQEWEGYEYAVDLSFAGNDAFQSPTGRAVGIAYVEEIRARLQHHLLTVADSSANVTLDGMASTFPLDQSLYFDFSHDTNIMSILTAFGLTQFAEYLPANYFVPHDLIVSHMEPFGARLDMEIIQAPMPVTAARSPAVYATNGSATTYIHFLLNQRTVPLGRSYPACGARLDGWCELATFLNVTASATREAQYDYACNGNYTATPYGTIHNGAPLPPGYPYGDAILGN